MAEHDTPNAAPTSIRSQSPFDEDPFILQGPATARSSVEDTRPRSDGSRRDYYEQQRGGPRQDQTLRIGPSEKSLGKRTTHVNQENSAISPPALPQALWSSRGDRLEHRPDQHRGTRPASSGTWAQRTSHDEEQNLDEVAGPRPAESQDDGPRHQRGSYLEDQRESYDEAQPPSFHRPRRLGDSGSQHGQLSNWATQLYTVCYLIFFSLLGTLARLGMQWLTFYPGAPIMTPVLWANFAGSLVMGFLSEDKRLFRNAQGVRSPDLSRGMQKSDDEKHDEDAAKKEHSKVKKTIPLYIGLATGFCGSFTSFSSFERDAFLALSNNLPTPVNHPVSAPGLPYPDFSSTITRNGGYSFMALLAVIISTIGLSLCALFVGAHLALALDRFTPTLRFTFVRRILDPLVVLLGLGCWIGAVLLSIFPPDRTAANGNEAWRGTVLFALVFAPVGCLLRWYASLKLNGIAASFPLGTFSVNIFGCAVLAMCYDLQHAPLNPRGGISSMLPGGGRVGCQVLNGIDDGFCGCLTTVSTFVAELQGLRRRHAYFYGTVSVLTGLAVMVIIMGSVRWSIGWDTPACVTMRTDL